MKTKLYRFKNLILGNSFFKKKLIERKVQNGELMNYKESQIFLDEAESVLLDRQISSNFLVGIVLDGNEYEGYHKTRSYYPKFERFLNNNDIKYKYYNIYDSNWIEEAKQFDLIVWHTYSDPMTQSMAKSKFYVLDKRMNKHCVPSYDELWTYEEKVHSHYLYKLYGLPEIPTFVTHDKQEALNFISKTSYPIISKIATGSGSAGVEKIDSYKEALSLVNKVFSYKGRKTYFSFERQKNYVYFQQFISDADYDLRIYVVGNKYFGYYRYPKKGDYKASGAGIYEKKEIPKEALELASMVKDKFGCRFLATDMLYSKSENKYYIIESSIFIGIDTCEQLVVDGVAGYYERDDKGSFVFQKGKYWLPELMLKESLK